MYVQAQLFAQASEGLVGPTISIKTKDATEHNSDDGKSGHDGGYDGGGGGTSTGEGDRQRTEELLRLKREKEDAGGGKRALVGARQRGDDAAKLASSEGAQDSVAWSEGAQDSGGAGVGVAAGGLGGAGGGEH